MAGIAGNTTKQYAHRGEYDPRDLENVLQWVNGRRAVKGLPLIGLPSENVSAADSDCSLVLMPPTQNGLLWLIVLAGLTPWQKLFVNLRSIVKQSCRLFTPLLMCVDGSAIPRRLLPGSMLKQEQKWPIEQAKSVR